ncbi:hypothetical protein CVT26_011342 [Gymnopilus dilepis]|uniref:Uncharacterized protein n=1 Tax=Gymnopilus dilepis TaxID=231916 RepID=A0A409W8V6_9AGAR|nr:hypothetical protein CVT26_011342 [Gymnopilus dilepis]
MVASLNGTPTTSGPMAYQGPQLPARFFFPGLNLANDYNMRGVLFPLTRYAIIDLITNLGRSATSSSALSTVPTPWRSKPRATSSVQVYTPTQQNINHGLGQVFQSHASQPTSHLRGHNPPLDISSTPQGAGFRQQITIGHQINAVQRHPGRQVPAQTNSFGGANGAAYSGPPYSGLRQLADHSLVHGMSSSSSFPDVLPYCDAEW